MEISEFASSHRRDAFKTGKAMNSFTRKPSSTCESLCSREVLFLKNAKTQRCDHSQVQLATEAKKVFCRARAQARERESAHKRSGIKRRFTTLRSCQREEKREGNHWVSASCAPVLSALAVGVSVFVLSLSFLFRPENEAYLTGMGRAVRDRRRIEEFLKVKRTARVE